MPARQESQFDLIRQYRARMEFLFLDDQVRTISVSQGDDSPNSTHSLYVMSVIVSIMITAWLY